MKCVHRGVHKYPLVPSYIKFWEEKNSVELAVSPCFTHPLILGINWPRFQTTVKEIFLDGFFNAQCGICVVLDGEAVPGSSMSPPPQGDMEDGEGSVPPPFAGIPFWHFLLERSCNEALRQAFDQVKVIDSQKIQSNVALSPTCTFPLLKIGYGK